MKKEQNGETRKKVTNEGKEGKMKIVENEELEEEESNKRGQKLTKKQIDVNRLRMKG